MIIITGATGHLGRLVVDELLKTIPASEIGVAVRNVAKAADLAARGVDVRHADYDEPESLQSAFAGAEKVLLISSSEAGRRLPQHEAAIDAIGRSGAKLLVYTSLLHADTTGMSLAAEHWPTEEMVRASGVPFVILRNGWYLENYTEHFAPALQYGAITGAAGDGRISAASRADFATAAAKVLTTSGHEGKVYELAGDASFSMSELAEELSRVAGEPVAYKNVPAVEFRSMLASFGMPPAIAYMLADADAAIARGELTDDGGDLRRLIGRPTTALADAVRAAV